MEAKSILVACSSSDNLASIAGETNDNSQRSRDFPHMDDQNPFSFPEPLVFRLEMSLTSSSGRAKKFEFFHWLKMNAQQKKYTRINF